jgi:hypothetical protein
MQLPEDFHIEELPDGYVIRHKHNGREMKILGANLLDVTFSQVGLGCLNITRLEKAIANAKVKFECMTLVFDLKSIKTFIENRDIDKERLREILQDKAFYDKPVMCIRAPSGDWIVDGNHRIAAHLVCKQWEVPGHVIPVAEVEPFLVRMWLDGQPYVENEMDLRLTFGIHHDQAGRRR